MWIKRTILGALATVLCAIPALSGQTPIIEQKQPSPAPVTEQPQADRTATMGDLVNMDVWSADGDKLGTVSKVNLGADGKVKSIHVEIGAFLGIGSRMVRVRAEQFINKDKRLELALTAEEAEALPEVEAAR